MTFNDIKELLAENDFEAAFEALEQKELNFNQKDDILKFKQRFSDLRDKEIKQLVTQEKASVIRNNILNDLLAFFDKIENGEYEPQPKPTFQEKITNIPSKHLLLTILLLEILIGILGELLPDEVKPILEELVGKENYWIAWTIVFVLTIAAFLYLTFRKEKPQTQPTETNFFDKEETKITKNLIERYESRLEQKTDKRLPVDLKLTYTKEGTSDDFKHWDKGIRTGKIIKDDWVTTLQKHEHILIVGKPGAGKSTQLLELAVAWLKDESCPQIPVVFNLAPWTFDDQHFHEWLQSALVSGYGFSKSLAKEAIEKNRILPLLDGLDEVGTKEETEAKKNELRSHCLEAIDRYLSLFNVPFMVICSRIEEFKTAADAPIKAEILINPLTPKQIRQTFINALKDKQNLTNNDENAVNNLRQLLKTHPTLETVLCTPFYYNIALDVFGGRTQQHDLPDKQEDLERYLLEVFLDKKLANTENKRGYSIEKTRHYLGFVANVLDLENLKTFELVSFQPKYLEDKKSVNLIFFIIVSSIIILPTSLFIPTILSLCIGWGVAKFLELLKHYALNFDVKPKENKTLEWKNLLNANSLISIITLGLIMGFFVGLILSLKGYFYRGMIAGIILGIIRGIYIALIKTSFYENLNKPYQRLQNEIFVEIPLSIFMFTITYSLFLYAGEFFYMFNTVSFILVIIAGGIFFGLIESSFLNHILLRLALKLEQKLPLRWVSFFTYATKARILEQDGGQWRFRHQLLQDYFLEVWRKKN